MPKVLNGPLYIYMCVCVCVCECVCVFYYIYKERVLNIADTEALDLNFITVNGVW